MMMRSTPLDGLFDILVDTFGEDWLTWRGPKNSKVYSSERRHPLQIAWRKIPEQLTDLPFGSAALSSSIDLRGSSEVTLVERVALTLGCIGEAPGFADILKPRLLRATEFESALNECEIAASFARAGLQLEFVPTEDMYGKRTPDIRVRNKVRNTEIECKLKNPIESKGLDKETYDWLQTRCRELLIRLNLNIEITALVIGPPTEETLARALAHIESRVGEGFRGYQYEIRVPMVLGVIDSPGILPPMTPQGYQSYLVSRGCVVGNSKPIPLADGAFQFSNHRAMGVFPLDGTTYDQIYTSIRDARGQLSADGLAILVVTLSLGGPPELDSKKEVYLNILSNAVQNRTWGGGRNTRFGAIVLKLSPVTREASAGSWRYTTSGSASKNVTQPGLHLPENLSISELVESLSRMSHDDQERSG